MNKIGLALICILPLATACGDMSEEDAQKVFQAAQTVSQSGGNTGGALTVDQASNVSFSWDCPANGAASFDGSWEQGTGFDYTVAFDGCTNDGITLDGSWSYTFVANGTVAAGFTYEWSYKGELTADGEVSGDCDFNLAGSASFGGGQGAEASVSGDACGRDVDWSFSYTP